MQSMSGHPIGVFDSGIGGLTVVRALMERLPFENIIYFGDTARVPYGVKSPETITQYATEITHFLLQKDVKLLIVACNTMAAVLSGRQRTFSRTRTGRNRCRSTQSGSRNAQQIYRCHWHAGNHKQQCLCPRHSPS